MEIIYLKNLDLPKERKSVREGIEVNILLFFIHLKDIFLFKAIKEQGIG